MDIFVFFLNIRVYWITNSHTMSILSALSSLELEKGGMRVPVCLRLRMWKRTWCRSLRLMLASASHSPLYFLRQYPSLNLELLNSARPSSQQTPGLLSSLLHQCPAFNCEYWKRNQIPHTCVASTWPAAQSHNPRYLNYLILFCMWGPSLCFEFKLLYLREL